VACTKEEELIHWLPMDIRFLLQTAFGVIIGTFLIIDLGIMQRRPHAVSVKSAAYQTLFWFVMAMLFAASTFYFYDGTKAVEFVSAYVTEQMLSVDNLFIMLLIFNYFNVEEKYRHRVLFYGILGALVMRALFIGLGTVVVSMFHWVLYIFGAILIYTGIKLFFDKKEEHVDFTHSRIYKLAHKYMRFTQSHHGGKFFVREGGKLFATSLFLVVLLIEWTDLVFAIDSIPAAFSISQDYFVVYTSNIFAIVGLRAMFFLLEAVIHRFHHLQKGLSLVLIAIGAKMLLEIVHIEISSVVSLAIVAACLIGSLLLSVLFPKKF
jgi:tellurite resistance protein TerC